MIDQPSRRLSVLISQLSIIAVSIITAIVPQYHSIVFIVFFMVFAFFMFRVARRRAKVPPQKELGSPLFREDNALKVAMFDKALSNELKKHAMATMSLFMLTFLILLIFPMYRVTIFPLTFYLFSSVFNNELIALFLSFLAMYEFVFGTMSLIRHLIVSRAGAFNLMLPYSYVLYRSGLVLNNKIFFKLSDKHCYEYDSSRRFVEIRSRDGQSTRVRLYTDAASELKDRVREVKLSECS